MEKKNLWSVYNDEQLAQLEQLNESYKNYLDKGKTERDHKMPTCRSQKTNPGGFIEGTLLRFES